MQPEVATRFTGGIRQESRGLIKPGPQSGAPAADCRSPVVRQPRTVSPARAGEQPPVGEQAAGPRRNGGPAIAVERDGDARRDKYRRYKIMVDGRRVGSIQAGGRREIGVRPGPHVVQLHIDWCSSPELRVDLAAGQRVVLQCGPDLTMEDKLGAVTVARNQYIRLELAGPT